MTFAARVFAVMLIAQSLLLPASISTSTSAEIQVSGSTVQSCTDTGVTFSTCSAALPPVISLFVPWATASVQGSSGWNGARFSYSAGAYSPDPTGMPVIPIARGSWTVSDTVTVHGGTGAGVLLLGYHGYTTTAYGATYAFRANGINIPFTPPLRPQIGYPGAFDFPAILQVPFTFDVPFALTFGVDESVTHPPEFDTSGSASFSVFTRVYTGDPMIPGSTEILDVSYTRESGAPMGVPEPGSLVLCAIAFAVVSGGRLRRLRR